MSFAPVGKNISPTLLELENKIKEEPEKTKNLLDIFWQKITKDGTPLFEKTENKEEYIVTFLIRQEVTSNELSVWCGIFGVLPSRAIMKQLPGTDIHFVSEFVLPKSKLRYWMVHGIPQLINPDNLQEIVINKSKNFIDPLNKFSKELKIDQNDTETRPFSLLMTPDSDPDYWSIDRGNPKGFLQERNIEMNELLRSQIQVKNINKDNRDPYNYKVVIYTPHGFNNSQHSYPFILIFDGGVYFNNDYIPTHLVLDNLIAEGKIPPTIGIFFYQKDRNKELLHNYDFAKFICEKVIPNVREDFRLSTDPKQAVVAGSSFGGLCSMYIGLNFPHIFGKVLCQSGSFSTPSKVHGTDYRYLINQFIENQKVSIDIYMSIGVYEGKEALFNYPSHFYSNHNMRDVLHLKGYNYKFKIVNGGHDYVFWREDIADGLIFLIGNKN